MGRLRRGAVNYNSISVAYARNELGRERGDMLLNAVHADHSHPTEAITNSGHVEEVRRSILERLRALLHPFQSVLDGHEVHCAASEVLSAQQRQRVAPGHERSDSGWVAEHLVERECDEVG